MDGLEHFRRKWKEGRSSAHSLAWIPDFHWSTWVRLFIRLKLWLCRDSSLGSGRNWHLTCVGGCRGSWRVYLVTFCPKRARFLAPNVLGRRPIVQFKRNSCLDSCWGRVFQQGWVGSLHEAIPLWHRRCSIYICIHLLQAWPGCSRTRRVRFPWRFSRTDLWWRSRRQLLSACQLGLQVSS